MNKDTDIYSEIEKYIMEGIRTSFFRNDFLLHFYGSFAKHKLGSESDVDVLVISKQKISPEELEKLVNVQKSFKQKFDYPLSLDIQEYGDFLLLLKSGSGLLKFLRMKKESSNKDFFNEFIFSTTQEKMLDLLLNKCLEIKRMFLFNLANQNPTARIFKNDGLSKKMKTNDYVVSSFSSMLKHLALDINLDEINFVPIEIKRQITEKYEETAVAAVDRVHKMIDLLDNIRDILIKNKI